MKPSRSFFLLIVTVVSLGWLSISAHAQVKNDISGVTRVSHDNTFALVAELPDQSAIAGMATGVAGLIALHSRRQRRKTRAARRANSDFVFTGPLRRMQPAVRIAPDRADSVVFHAPRLIVAPRQMTARPSR